VSPTHQRQLKKIKINMKLHNKTAAITGAASGIGLATTQSLIANGAPR